MNTINVFVYKIKVREMFILSALPYFSIAEKSSSKLEIITGISFICIPLKHWLKKGNFKEEEFLIFISVTTPSQGLDK